jgi:enoyl-CoA hydratase
MMCDFIIAADTAKFGQPEIKIGIIPGAGGTPRLPRAAGKAKAMDIVLTKRMMDTAEAERAGLVSRVVAAGKLMDEVLAAAAAICTLGLPGITMANECVNRAFEGSLADCIRFERRPIHSLFATENQGEDVGAFFKKRKPGFQQRGTKPRHGHECHTREFRHGALSADLPVVATPRRARPTASLRWRQRRTGDRCAAV